MVDITSLQPLSEILDLTYLNEDIDTDKFNQFVSTAKELPVAALCVYRRDLKKVHSLFPDKPIATVVNFPQGECTISKTIAEIKQAINMKSSEIDLVFPYKAYLNGEKEQALSFIKACQEICHPTSLLKVIIETGYLNDLTLIDEIARALVQLKVDFIKTSTGKIYSGANIETVTVILKAIRHSNTGIKISGGIRTIEQALVYMKIALEETAHTSINKHWFRIGASQLGNELITEIKRYKQQ